ncbi:hypothetical protein DFQ27_000076 [Actinomortierella ambigua]|uniref:Uncharacterized protein n=1 Tax=Actinomortierella ambigua TaxID=1343610 RepID=A0A9P6UD19_9FUNG|nr:hypothetical protein DFQ27_000076 [Actinomortierella ambigua]
MFAHPAEFNFPHHHPRRQQQQLLQQQQQQQQQQPPQQQQQQPVQGSPSSLFSPASSSSAPTTFHSACKKRPLYFEPEFLAALDSSLTDSPNAGASSPSAADSISPNPTVGRPTKKVKKNVAVSKTPLGRAINPLDRARGSNHGTQRGTFCKTKGCSSSTAIEHPVSEPQQQHF